MDEMLRHITRPLRRKIYSRASQEDLNIVRLLVLWTQEKKPKASSFKSTTVKVQESIIINMSIKEKTQVII